LCPAGDVAFFDGYEVTYSGGIYDGGLATDGSVVLVPESVLYTGGTGGSQQGWQLAVVNNTIYNVNVAVTASCWTES
jgi:hypothetical protein